MLTEKFLRAIDENLCRMPGRTGDFFGGIDATRVIVMDRQGKMIVHAAEENIPARTKTAIQTSAIQMPFPGMEAGVARIAQCLAQKNIVGRDGRDGAMTIDPA